MSDFFNHLLFGLYPYLSVAVFLVGSFIRFERGQYGWRSGSSQLLRQSHLRLASNLFHIGVLAILAGHAVGLLTPHAVYAPIISAPQKQLLAIVAGGVAGSFCLVGLLMLLVRRLGDARIRATSTRMDIAVLLLLLAQLCLGLISIPYSLGHRDGEVMLRLSEWAQRIVTFRSGAADEVAGTGWVFQAHIVIGMTLLLLFPFSRLVHIWSAPVGYIFRPYQIMRRRDGRAQTNGAGR
jgi:nitrate reductase gamma subunit